MIWSKERFQGIFFLLLIPLWMGGCRRRDDDLVRKLLELESPTYTVVATRDARLEELHREVQKYRSRVKEKVQATEKLLTYYRMLALAYMDRGMFGPALEALDSAIQISPEQAPLFLFKGISAARLAKGTLNPEERDALFQLAERAYLRCLELDATSANALYAISILHVFEFDAPSRAVPFLQRLLEQQTQHVAGMFLLARAFVSMGRIEDAVAMYDRIIDTPAAGGMRDQARELRDQVLRGAAR